jgi:uncharacterized membrane protein
MQRTCVDALLSKLSFTPVLWAAVLLSYTLPTAVLLGYTWHNTRPEYHGFDWVMVYILTLPTLAIIDPYFHKTVPVQFEVLIGLGVNTTALYLFARLLCHIAERYRR